MKKILVPLIGATLIGASFGLYIFSQYKAKVETAFNSTETIYVLQQGVYSSLDNVKKYAAKIENYAVDHDGEYYRVYVGITHNKNDVSRLKEYFIKKGNDIYVRELTTDNANFIELIKQYDLLLESSSTDAELLQIEKQVLVQYKELVLKNE